MDTYVNKNLRKYVLLKTLCKKDIKIICNNNININNIKTIYITFNYYNLFEDDILYIDFNEVVNKIINGELYILYLNLNNITDRYLKYIIEIIAYNNLKEILINMFNYIKHLLKYVKHSSVYLNILNIITMSKHLLLNRRLIYDSIDFLITKENKNTELQTLYIKYTLKNKTNEISDKNDYKFLVNTFNNMIDEINKFEVYNKRSDEFITKLILNYKKIIMK